jgi:uncharacterized protein (UPF0548 family)
MAEARGLGPRQCEFDSHRPYVIRRHVALPRLRLNYDNVGASLSDLASPDLDGYRTYEKSVCIGYGDARWDFAARAIGHWELKTRSGFTVVTEGAAPASHVVLTHRYWLIAHVGPFRISEPVEVISVLDEPTKKGFAYGTLSGHPIRGEEAFIVDRRADGSVWLTIRSVSRSADGYWRVLYPATVFAQGFYRRRYLRALAGPS